MSAMKYLIPSCKRSFRQIFFSRFYSNHTIPSEVTKRTNHWTTRRIKALASGGLSTGLLAVVITTLTRLYPPSETTLMSWANAVSEVVINRYKFKTNSFAIQSVTISSGLERVIHQLELSPDPFSSLFFKP